MSADAESRVWSGRRWAGAILGVFVVQILLVFALSRRGPAAVRAQSRAAPARLAMVMGSKLEDRLMAGIGGIDPALFAVAHRSGFSARGSLVLSTSAPVLASLLEPPKWLQGSLGSFEVGPRTNGGLAGGQQSEFFSVERPIADFSSLGGSMSSPGRETRIRLSGGLSKRAILHGEIAPVLASLQVVRSSVVEVGVDSDGFVTSARLVDSSTLAAADQEALKHARRIRFQSDAGTNRVGLLDWGKVSFPWQISGASVTNRIF